MDIGRERLKGLGINIFAGNVKKYSVHLDSERDYNGLTSAFPFVKQPLNEGQALSTEDKIMGFLLLGGSSGVNFIWISLLLLQLGS